MTLYDHHNIKKNVNPHFLFTVTNPVNYASDFM